MPNIPQVYISYSFVNESVIADGTRVKITQTPLTTTDAARNWVTYTTLPPYTQSQLVYGSIGQLALNNKYYVRFLPYNTVGEAPVIYPDLTIYSKPAAPTALAPTVSDTTMSVNWSAAVDPLSGGFKIRYRQSNVTPVAWTEVLVAASARTYVISSLPNATAYTIEVSSYNQNDGYIEQSAAFSTTALTSSGYGSSILALDPIHYYRLNDLGSGNNWGDATYTGTDSGVGSSSTGSSPFSKLALAKSQYNVTYNANSGLLLGSTADDESVVLRNNGSIYNSSNNVGDEARRVYFNRPDNVGKATIMFLYKSAITANSSNNLFTLWSTINGAYNNSEGGVELVETMDASGNFQLKLNIQDDASPNTPWVSFAASPISNAAPALGATAHVAVVIEPNSQKVYYNGTLVASSTISSIKTLRAAVGYWYKSWHYIDSTGEFAIDEVSIFNKALTAAQILAFKQAAI